jgi:hypothetical protein
MPDKKKHAGLANPDSLRTERPNSLTFLDFHAAKPPRKTPTHYDEARGGLGAGYISSV